MNNLTYLPPINVRWITTVLSLFVLGDSASGVGVYTFQTVVALDASASLSAYPQLNNRGQVTFVARSGTNPATSPETFLWVDGTATALGLPGSFGGSPIDDAGYVYSSKRRSVRYDPVIGLSSVVFDDLVTGSTLAVSPNGHVVAGIEVGDPLNPNVETRVSKPDGTATTRFSNDRDSGRWADYNVNSVPLPDISNHGIVAFAGVSSEFGGVVIDDGNSFARIPYDGPPVRRFGNVVDINNLGHVAFTAELTGETPGGRNLYIYRDGISELVAEGANFEYLTEGGLAINDTGDLAFFGTYQGRSGLYVGGDPQEDFIIRSGDTLDGGVLKTLLVRRGMLNDAGQISFYATLDDNADGVVDRKGIFLATPTTVSVPETSIALPMAAVAAIAFNRRRKIV